jgi:hypothetical protein
MSSVEKRETKIRGTDQERNEVIRRVSLAVLPRLLPGETVKDSY